MKCALPLSLLCILILSACSNGHKQTAANMAISGKIISIKNIKCQCPANELAATRADTVFTLGNGKSIVLCGFRNTGSTPVDFSEFVLAECGNDSIIRAWDGTTTARIRTVMDTLMVEEIWNLPTGKDFSFRPTIYWINYIFYKGERLEIIPSQNYDLPKYSSRQIKQVLKEYEESTGKLNDTAMELANKLFIAAISGSEKAMRYFYDFDDKFTGLDGAFAEEYKDLAAVLYLYRD